MMKPTVVLSTDLAAFEAEPAGLELLELPQAPNARASTPDMTSKPILGAVERALKRRMTILPVLPAMPTVPLWPVGAGL